MNSQNENRKYVKNINRAFQYIDENLTETLSLEKIATASFYSPFHFHRIFRAITGETVHAYVARVKIEKSAIMLQQKNQLPIADIAVKAGYDSHSVFARAFKKHYGISPSVFRKKTAGQFSKIRKVNSKNGQNAVRIESYLSRMENLMTWITKTADIQIVQNKEMNAAALTHIGDKKIGKAFNRLIRWSERNRLIENPDFKMGLIYYDSYKVTSPDKIRMKVFLVTKKIIPANDEIDAAVIQGGKHIKASLTISPEEIGRAWTALFIWMNDNDYLKAKRPPFEIYHNDFNSHPEKKCILDLYIPIE